MVRDGQAAHHVGPQRLGGEGDGRGPGMHPRRVAAEQLRRQGGRVVRAVARCRLREVVVDGPQLRRRSRVGHQRRPPLWKARRNGEACGRQGGEEALHARRQRRPDRRGHGGGPLRIRREAEEAPSGRRRRPAPRLRRFTDACRHGRAPASHDPHGADIARRVEPEAVAFQAGEQVRRQQRRSLVGAHGAVHAVQARCAQAELERVGFVRHVLEVVGEG